MKKRLFGMFLAVCMVVGMMSVGALAADAPTVTNLKFGFVENPTDGSISKPYATFDVSGADEDVATALVELLGADGSSIGSGYPPASNGENYENYLYFWDDGLTSQHATKLRVHVANYEHGDASGYWEQDISDAAYAEIAIDLTTTSKMSDTVIGITQISEGDATYELKNLPPSTSVNLYTTDEGSGRGHNFALDTDASGSLIVNDFKDENGEWVHDFTNANSGLKHYLDVFETVQTGEKFDITITRYEIVYGESNEEITAKPPQIVSALSTPSKVLVDGEDTAFDAYNIDGNNYFKLRDLANVVSGTEKQFEVTWDEEMNAINLISGEAYTEVGGEMAAASGMTKEGALSTSVVYVDGVETEFTAYNIDGNNYFKLRDVAKVFDIGVTWDGETSTIGIDTAISYVE